jgi:hypothetical protein
MAIIVVTTGRILLLLVQYFTNHGMFLATVEAFKVILTRHEATRSVQGIFASILYKKHEKETRK